MPGDCLPEQRCPMGLHPRSKDSAPTSSMGFLDEVGDAAVSAFLCWWDEQYDAMAAVDEVWGG